MRGASVCFWHSTSVGMNKEAASKPADKVSKASRPASKAKITIMCDCKLTHDCKVGWCGHCKGEKIRVRSERSARSRGWERCHECNAWTTADCCGHVLTDWRSVHNGNEYDLYMYNYLMCGNCYCDLHCYCDDSSDDSSSGSEA